MRPVFLSDTISHGATSECSISSPAPRSQACVWLRNWMPSSVWAAGRMRSSPTTLPGSPQWRSCERASSAIISWKEVCNRHRPLSTLGNLTPAEFPFKSSPENRPPEPRNAPQDFSLRSNEKRGQASLGERQGQNPLWPL